jgi:hypothetical protein
MIRKSLIQPNWNQRFEAAGFEAHRLKGSDDIRNPRRSRTGVFEIPRKNVVSIVFSVPLVLLGWAYAGFSVQYGLLRKRIRYVLDDSLLLTLPVLWAGRDLHKGFSLCCTAIEHGHSRCDGNRGRQSFCLCGYVGTELNAEGFFLKPPV